MLNYICCAVRNFCNFYGDFLYMFDEDNTTEQMMLSVLQENGWKYIPAEDLPRQYSDVMVEPMVKDALIRLNPEIAEDPTRADDVIYRLRSLILSVQPHNLVTQNELFKKLVFEENSFPFGKDGRMVPIRFFWHDDRRRSCKE